MSGRLPALRRAEVIRVLERNGFRLLRSTKHRTYTDDGAPGATGGGLTSPTRHNPSWFVLEKMGLPKTIVARHADSEPNQHQAVCPMQ
jgi:hypothetical protein